MRIILLVLTLVAQPVWWLGLIREWFTADRRLTAERRFFGSAVYQDKFEVRHFVLLSLSYGVLASVISVLLGITIPIGWAIGYVILCLLAVIIGPAAGIPITVLTISVLCYQVVDPVKQVTGVDTWLQTTGIHTSETAMIGLLAVIVMTLFIGGLWLHRIGGRFEAPRIYSQRRGKLIAGYRFNELLVVPMLVMVPGDWFTSHLAFWPVLNINHQSVTFIFLPLLIGLRMTIFKQMQRTALKRFAKWELIISALGGLLLIGSFFSSAVFLPAVVGLYLFYLILLVWTRWHDRHQSFWFSKVDRGVRVLGIKPETPAAKMAINTGDIIVECNHEPVNSETEFYEALLLNSTYCHLRLQTPQGDLKVTETAIFAGSPHEIGIVVFRDATH